MWIPLFIFKTYIKRHNGLIRISKYRYRIRYDGRYMTLTTLLCNKLHLYRIKRLFNIKELDYVNFNKSTYIWWWYKLTCPKHKECIQHIKDFDNSIVNSCKRKHCPVEGRSLIQEMRETGDIL
jgi:hypothetical protein